MLPRGWALDDAKPIFGSHWQIELIETRDDRDIHLSVTAASIAAAVEASRTCRSLSALVDALPSQATVEIYVGTPTPD
ncbi:MAG: hypothetical protein ACHQ01_11135 [Candidatus Limnocylindrales bacterium]